MKPWQRGTTTGIGSKKKCNMWKVSELNDECEEKFTAWNAIKNWWCRKIDNMKQTAQNMIKNSRAALQVNDETVEMQRMQRMWGEASRGEFGERKCLELSVGGKKCMVQNHDHMQERRKENVNGQSRNGNDHQWPTHQLTKVKEIQCLFIIRCVNSGFIFPLCTGFHIALCFLNNFHEIFIWKVCNWLQIFPRHVAPCLDIESISFAIWNDSLPCWKHVRFQNDSTLLWLHSRWDLIEL